MAIDNYEVWFNTTGDPVTEADTLVATEPYATSGDPKSVPHTHGQAPGTTVYYGVRSHDPDTGLYSAFVETDVTVALSDNVTLTYGALSQAGFVCDTAVTVDWGDTSAPEDIAAGALASHTYATAATATVTWTGAPLTSFALEAAADQPTSISVNDSDLTTLDVTQSQSIYKLKYVEFLAPSMLTSCASLFSSQTSLETVTGPVASVSTDFNKMFDACFNLTGVSGIDTAPGTNFNSMFNSCFALVSAPLLETSAGTDFSDMFNSCTSLTTVPLLDTSSGTLFYGMFRGNSVLPSVPALNTSLGTNFNTMFANCSSLTAVPALDVSNGTSFINTFENCTALTEILAYGFRYSVAVGYSDPLKSCNLDTAAINTFFTNLGTADNTAAQQTVTITNCPGAATCDRTIATAKGWTVTG